MKKIDFFIIGTQKAATTSLFYYLSQHPDIYFSEVKELMYFIDRDIYNRGDNYLRSFFYKYQNQRSIGTSHVHMLPCLNAPERVKKHNPNAKFIVLLRNPVERAISAYQYAVKNGWEKQSISINDAFTLEKERLGAVPLNYDLLYFYNGLYYQHLCNWRKYFDKKNFIILTTEELQLKPHETIKSILNFLNVDENISIDTSVKHNVKAVSRYPSLQRAILSRNRLKTNLGLLIPPKYRVLIRSKLIPHLLKFNTVVKEESKALININEVRTFCGEYFQDDLKNLNSCYGIKF